MHSWRHAFALAALLALAACTQVYFKDFAVEPQDQAYTARAQFDDIKGYVLSRGLRILVESEGFLAVQLDDPQDTLQIRLTAGQVELTLMRRSSGADFPAEQVRVFQQGLESRLRERTGQVVSVRLVGERTKPMTNLRLQ